MLDTELAPGGQPRRVQGPKSQVQSQPTLDLGPWTLDLIARPAAAPLLQRAQAWKIAADNRAARGRPIRLRYPAPDWTTPWPRSTSKQTTQSTSGGGTHATLCFPAGDIVPGRARAEHGPGRRPADRPAGDAKVEGRKRRRHAEGL